MEKIQEAIAKARAQRVADPAEAGPGQLMTQTRVAPGTARYPARPAAPESAGPERPGPERPGTAPAASEADIKARWQAVQEVTFDARHLRREHILAYEGGPPATPFAVMRTRLLQQARQNGWRRIAITSPGPRCGKSFLTLNLAFSLARHPEERILVAEMDFHRPSMARTLGLKEPHDLAAALEGRATPESQMLRHGVNLAITTNRGKITNAAELLQSTRTAAVIDAVDATFAPTIMLFDMPPMMAGDDTMAFMSNVDAALIVAAAEQTTIRQIDQCERELASQTGIMGVIVNKCRYMEKDSSYDYYD